MNTAHKHQDDLYANDLLFSRLCHCGDIVSTDFFARPTLKDATGLPYYRLVEPPARMAI